jgi:glycosyltransferase involved in cell wall biosynthesis
MRIACYHNLPSGGAKRVLYEHTRGLRAAGHEVVVYQLQTADAAFCDVAEVADRVVRVPCVWRELPAPRRGPAGVADAILHTGVLYGNYRRLAAVAAGVAGKLSDEGFDLAYVHHDAFETAPTLLRYARIPTVYFCQEPSRGVFESPLFDEQGGPATPASPASLWRRALGGAASVVRRYRLLNERTNTQAATLVLANSAYSAESILRAHGRVARLCTLGVDAEFFTSVRGPRGAHVLSVGRFDPQKGFRFLIRAIGHVPAEVRPPLMLVGDHPDPGEIAYLRQLATACGVSLTLHVRVREEALRDLYARARLFVYAPYLEPLGLAALEAMACGTPVLGVREGGVRETVLDGSTGRLVERHLTGFAAALEEMLADPGALEAMGRQAREYVRREWTWERSVGRLLRLFDEALVGHAEPPL